MNNREIEERTNNLINIFDFTVKLNQYRFKDLHFMTVAELIIEFSDVDYSFVDVRYLAEHIRNYSEKNDTGIYY